MVVMGAVLPVFCMAGAGALMRKLDWLTEAADRSLLTATINVFIPCLILDSCVGNAALHRISNVIAAPLVGFGTVILGIVLAWSVRRASGITDNRPARTFAFSTGLYNYGYVPIPLALILYGHETVGVLFVHNVGVEMAIWTVGILLLTGATAGMEWKHIINPPLIAVVLGLILNAFGGDRWVPGFLLTTAKMLGQCAIPVGVILIGATIVDQAHKFHSKTAWRVIALAGLLRLAVLPVLFLLLARYLPCSLELKRVIVLQASMPAAVIPIVLAKHYGGDPATAVRIVLSTSAASLVTTPFWIRLGTQWVGLS